MRGLLLLVVAVGLLLATLGVVEWKYVLAPLLGLLVGAWGLATMRSFTRGAHGAELGPTEPEPLPPDERTLYWCEECGTELVLVVRGSGQPPRHCGTRMHERAEVEPS